MKLLAAVGTPSWFIAAAFQAVRASCAGEGLPSEKLQTTSLANLAEATPSLNNKKIPRWELVFFSGLRRLLSLI
ncbi:hypothetical protein ACLWBD_14905 [Bdellovibrio sp. HCB117]|uniref:hypothetical protein n=1 Tax=Bdellovibrio sp. HCB117 TaxID=3394359 RepID=UPI0039B53220